MSLGSSLASALKHVFTWWDGATIGTMLWSRRHGRLVGEDGIGNRYFESGEQFHGRARRWVIYHGQNDASRVPPEWHGWLHGSTDLIPETLPPPHEWERPPLPNLTGTRAAYLPAGHLDRGGNRAAAVGDYEAWTPGQ